MIEKIHFHNNHYYSNTQREKLSIPLKNKIARVINSL